MPKLLNLGLLNFTVLKLRNNRKQEVSKIMKKLPLSVSHKTLVPFMSFRIMWQILFKNIVSCQDNVSTEKFINTNNGFIREGSMSHSSINAYSQRAWICMTVEAMEQRRRECKQSGKQTKG